MLVPLLYSCTEGEQSSADSKFSQPTALVAVITVKPETITLADELPARVSAFQAAEIRPQVGGIIEKCPFEHGSEVEAGQELFQINVEPFKAEADSAAAVLQRAEAALVRSPAKFDRAKRLVETNVINREAYDDAVADLA